MIVGGGEYIALPSSKKNCVEITESASYPFIGASTVGMCLTPLAFLSVQNGTVRVLPAKQECPSDRLIDLIPQMIETAERLMKDNFECKNGEHLNGEHRCVGHRYGKAEPRCHTSGGAGEYASTAVNNAAQRADAAAQNAKQLADRADRAADKARSAAEIAYDTAIEASRAAAAAEEKLKAANKQETSEASDKAEGAE